MALRSAALQSTTSDTGGDGRDPTRSPGLEFSKFTRSANIPRPAPFIAGQHSKAGQQSRGRLFATINIIPVGLFDVDEYRTNHSNSCKHVLNIKCKELEGNYSFVFLVAQQLYSPLCLFIFCLFSLIIQILLKTKQTKLIQTKPCLTKQNKTRYDHALVMFTKVETK